MYTSKLPSIPIHHRGKDDVWINRSSTCCCFDTQTASTSCSAQPRSAGCQLRRDLLCIGLLPQCNEAAVLQLLAVLPEVQLVASGAALQAWRLSKRHLPGMCDVSSEQWKDTQEEA
jgi:hypothetical protein